MIVYLKKYHNNGKGTNRFIIQNDIKGGRTEYSYKEKVLMNSN